jgi:hypothetical protein
MDRPIGTELREVRKRSSQEIRELPLGHLAGGRRELAVLVFPSPETFPAIRTLCGGSVKTIWARLPPAQQPATDPEEMRLMLPRPLCASGLACTMLDTVGVEAGDCILDIAAGAGDQTLALAERVGPQGCILATDLSPQLVERLRHASKAGLSRPGLWMRRRRCRRARGYRCLTWAPVHTISLIRAAIERGGA